MFHVQVELLPGNNGVFEIEVKGKCMFYVVETWFPPAPGEISRTMKMQSA
jgi:hypothetical protein